MNPVAHETIYAATAVVCSSIAACSDLRSRRIPNALTGGTMLVALVLHAVQDGKSGVGQALAGAVIGFGVTVLFFLAGGMGAGDVKLMTAVGALLGPREAGTAILSAGICGAVFALSVAHQQGRVREIVGNAFLLLEHHRTEGLVPHPDLNLRSTTGLRIPFAVPIALGCLVQIAIQQMEKGWAGW